MHDLNDISPPIENTHFPIGLEVMQLMHVMYFQTGIF